VVLRADAAERGSRDWVNLQRLVQRALPNVRAGLLQSPAPILVVSAGLLARYDLMSVISEMESTAGRGGQTPSAWILLPTWHQGLPLIDGVAVPLVNTTGVIEISQAWLENTHRSRIAV
jgi:hypothetical protein